jgi:hypothetical protein
MLLSLQYISLQALCAFVIIARSLAMGHKYLIACCMAQSHVPLLQSTIVVVAFFNTT